jgi:hypothetical protein
MRKIRPATKPESRIQVLHTHSTIHKPHLNMIDHLLLRVPQSKFDETVAFYLTVLAPLGYKKIKEFPTAVGLGDDKKPDFSIVAKGDTLGNNMHFSFGAKGKYHRS